MDLIKYDKDAPFTDKKFDISKVAIPLHQNVGVPAEPIIKIGEVVKKGQLIAKIPDGKLSANIHASIDGKITEINSSITIKQ